MIASALGTSSVVVSIVTRPSDQGGSDLASNILVVIAAVITLLGGVFAGLQSFLNYAGRASSHHTAAVNYKAIIRELEQILTGPWQRTPDQALALVQNLRHRLDALEESSPVVDGEDWDTIEDKYRDIYLVPRAIDLSPAKPLPPEAVAVQAASPNDDRTIAPEPLPETGSHASRVVTG